MSTRQISRDLLNPFRNLFLMGLVCLILLSSVGVAQEGEKITALEVSGNERVNTLIILGQIKTKVGEEYSGQVIGEDVKRLYDLGYFYDVRVDATPYKEGIKVTFIVEEEFLIKEINLEGERALKEESLREIMALGQGDVFNKRLLKEDVEKLTSLYREKGYHLAQVKAEVKRLEEQGEVEITLLIEEGEAVRIVEIEIEGNHSFPDKRIKKIMVTRVDRLFRRGIFKEDVLQDDSGRIISFYRSQGFLKAEIVDRERRLDESGRLIYLRLKIEEGPQFKVGRIGIEGNVLFTAEQIRNELKMPEDSIYSPDGLKNEVRRIEDYYAGKGYIFARVEPTTDIREEEKRVDVLYKIREGRLAYIERIEVVGNVKTQDKVIRREIMVKPGDVFDGRKIDRSRQKIYNLGYFEEVTYYTTPGTRPHNKNLVFEVTERKTGAFIFGFGYSTVEDFIGFVELSQNNFDIKNSPTFTGAGQKVKIRAKLGTEKTEYDLSFTEPWLMGRPLSFGFDLYDTTREWDDYDEGRAGGRLRLGYPLWELIRGSVAYKYEDVEISDVDKSASSRIKREEGDFSTSSLKLGLNKDTRDSTLDPTCGYENSISLERAGGILGGDRDFTKYVGQASGYFRTFERWEKLILNLRLKGGLVEEYGDTEYVPIYERFYLGGANTIRGYSYRDVGPKDEKGEPIGGETFLLFNAEYTYPLVRNIKGAVFFDSGGVWEDTGHINSSDIKSGVGIGVRMLLPIGPIRLDYGYGIDRHAGRVHFTGGWAF
ncbi:outer membrane protein assembly factor BamA [bacterium]|nr:outer membrane protein assembly factor BamA [bacterium]